MGDLVIIVLMLAAIAFAAYKTIMLVVNVADFRGWFVTACALAVIVFLAIKLLTSN